MRPAHLPDTREAPRRGREPEKGSAEFRREAPLAPTRHRRLGRTLGLRWKRVRRALSDRFSSSLTRRIVVLNLGGLVALFVGFLYLNQFREGLIDARVQSLQAQAEIIAAAIAASATVDTDTITIDPEKLLQLAPGESAGVADESTSSLEFSINPERIGPVLRRLASPTRTRARIYDRDGYLLLDSRLLTSRGNVLRYDLPSTEAEDTTLVERTWNEVKRRFGPTDLPIYDENGGANGRVYPEVTRALSGGAQYVVRVNAKGETIVSVAVPIQRFRTVRGALLLSTQGGDIDKIIATERWAILRIFLVSAAVMFLLSLFLAGTIAEPMRRLAEAAERVRRGVKSRQEIPDFTDRSDEIGHLSGALRDMTTALYSRIEAIESFAADVAHELKNPLTSLRSAVETLPRMRSVDARDRLLAIIGHDVRRLDRLISDISDASRLDAELARGDMAPVDLVALLDAVVSMARQVAEKREVSVTLDIAPIEAGEHGLRPADAFVVAGHDSRLGQVIGNLIDNACSFSDPGSKVRVSLARVKHGEDGEGETGIEIVVDDDGPGIPAHAFERIFERFYTDRPQTGFGQNSGLGLSISRQIVEAHRGHVRALNRTVPVEGGPVRALDEDGEDAGPDLRIVGARFVVWLPAAA